MVKGKKRSKRKNLLPQNDMLINNLRKLADNWPSSHVAREKVSDFSGGLLHPRTMANLDAKGEGPEVRIRINKKKVAYTVESLIQWMIERSEIVEIPNKFKDIS